MPHLKFSDRLRIVLTDCDAERHIDENSPVGAPNFMRNALVSLKANDAKDRLASVL